MTTTVDPRRLAAETARLAARLRGGSAPVAVISDNRPEMLAARDAATAAERPLVPLHPRLAVRELRRLLERSRAGEVLASDAFVSRARDAGAAEVVRLEPVCDDALGPWRIPADGAPGVSAATVGATILFTSGTTGVPKGCVRGAEADAARAAELVATYGIGADDVHVVACPLAHSAPGLFARAARAVGATTVLLPGFSPASFGEAVGRERGTLFFLVPTQYARLLAEHRPLDRSSVRAAIVAGAPMPPALRRRAVDWLGERLWEFYGSSETGTISVLRPDEQLAHADTVGRVLPQVELRVLDPARRPVAPGAVGELFVRSPTVMDGYLDPDTGATQPVGGDGFVSVGDLGRIDGDGLLTLVDRVHDTIITGGVNVYPAEVERAIAEHPAVVAAVVVGVDDPDWGQRVCAVVATDGAALGLADLRAFLRPRLAPYKIPKALRLCRPAEIPVGASGKPQRRQARRLFEPIQPPPK